MDAAHMTPRLLIIEDDPATAQFLLSVLAPLATVIAVDTLDAARRCCEQTPVELLLLDLNLPDGNGEAWFMAQRAAGLTAPVIALSADLGVAKQIELKAQGFAFALAKPCRAETVIAAIRAQLPSLADAWNDTAGLAAVGQSADILARLRGLFLDELPKQREKLLAARDRGDVDAVRAVLHQLRSSCGLVGAEALGASVARLHAVPENATAWNDLFQAMAALRADLTPSA